MEGIILGGLLFAGYYINKDKSDTHTVYPNVQIPNFENTGNSVYDQTHFKDSKNYEIQQVNQRHDDSITGEKNIVDSMNIFGLQKNVGELNNSDDYLISNLSGEKITKKEFMKRDDNTTMEPFFTKETRNINLDDNRLLDGLQGGEKYYRNKRETTQFFAQEKDLGNVFGTQFQGAISSKDRYISGNYRTNELPFEQERVMPIDEKSEINQNIAMIYSQRNSTENRNVPSQQKVSFEGRVNHGKDMNSHRGIEGEVFKNHVSQDYENTSDRWLVTGGATKGDRRRETQILPDTNRQYDNKQMIGNAAPVSFSGDEERPMFRKSTNQQLKTDTFRNASLEDRSTNDDYNVNSFKIYANEREVTTEKTVLNNLKSDFVQPEIGIQDSIKNTIKQTTINSVNNGFVGTNEHELPTNGLQDKVRNNLKSTMLFDYTGNSVSNLPATTAQDQFYRADLNPNKEPISRLRNPVEEKEKLSNGVDHVNMEIKKIDSDYLTQRQVGLDKIYSEIPSENTCEYTRDKDTLNNTKISDRIDGSLLDPFRENPYTHSLSSFAY
tara:strand:- start:3835 stop:5490 length:1656 start_codon:yes stop_codon:yes gene_type:complete